MTVEAVTIDAYGTLVTLRDPVPSLRKALAARGADRSLADLQRAFHAEVAYYVPRSHEGRDEAALALLRRDCARVFLEAAGADIAPEEFAPAFVEALVFGERPARSRRAGRSPKPVCGSQLSRTGTSASTTTWRGSASRRSSLKSSRRQRPAHRSRIRRCSDLRSSV